MSGSLSWAKVFKGCELVTTALLLRGQMPAEHGRAVLLSGGFDKDEISTIFSFLRYKGILEVSPQNNWSLTSDTFSL
jgi:hypothetical protein